MSVCESGKIDEVLSEHDTKLFLSYFTLLDIPKESILMGLSFMRMYNLLPNDALILATCKLQNISLFASLDSDFTIPCSSENIRLINMNTLEDFLSKKW